MENDIILKFQRKHPITRFELGNNNFRNQHIQVIKNSYVATNQTKMPVSITFGFLCTRLVCSLYNPFPNLHLVSSTQRWVLDYREGKPVTLKLVNWLRDQTGEKKHRT